MAVKEYIDLFYHQELTLAGLAEQFYISKEYLASRFKQVYGCTVVRYIHRARLEAAKELLRQDELSVSSIASAVGFDHFSYFNKIFKREYGMTPTQFRESARRGES